MRRSRALRWRPVAGVVATTVLSMSGCSASSGSEHSAHGSAPPSPSTSATGAGSPTSSGGSRGLSGRDGIPGFSHVFVVVMENLSEQQALATPSIRALAHRYGFATSYYGVSHPSLPNYLALVSGSTWGVTSDCTACYVSGPNLASQLESAGIGWGAYFEGMPSPCFTGPESPDGSYAQKHDPFVYFGEVREVAALCSHLQPLSSLEVQLSSNSPSIPRFVWVTPNLCDDGHDCSSAHAGAWLTGFVDSVTSTTAWKDSGAMFVTWDEGTDDSGVDPSTGAVSAQGGGGNVLTMVISPDVGAGTEVSLPLDHYSLLRTIEDAFGLGLLGDAAAAGTRALGAFFGARG